MHRRTFLAGLAAAAVFPLDVAKRLAREAAEASGFWKSSFLPAKPLTIEDLNRAYAFFQDQYCPPNTLYGLRVDTFKVKPPSLTEPPSEGVGHFLQDGSE